MRATDTREPFELLRELLEEDRSGGRPWDPADFQNTTRLACEATRAPHWRDVIAETANAWRSAYEGTPSQLAGFSPRDLVIVGERY
jgi:hypothetical protein